jgi:hypothetical protein
MNTKSLTRTESFDCDGPAELDLRIRGGRIDVRVVDSPEVRVEISPEPADSRALEDTVESLVGTVSQGAYTPDEADEHLVRETRVSFTEGRNKLVIRGPRSFRRIGLAVVVEAPRHSKLNVQTHRGAISTSGVFSDLRAVTGAGPISIDEVEGSADVATGAGHVRVGRVAGRLKARLGSGELEAASIEGDGATVATGRGDVWLGAVSCDAQVRTGHGGVVVADVAGGSISLASGSGDLRVGIHPGVAAELDVVSGSGDVRSELDVSHDRPAGAPTARIRMRTGRGLAVVERAGGTARAG